MKITGVKPILCDGGFRPWTFVKVTTDEGIVGYGDSSDWASAGATAATLQELEPMLIGLDPANIEQIWWMLFSKTVRSLGGIAHKAMSGINSALWDIKGKKLGVPVYELLGGRMRDSIKLYWTQCASSRALHHDVIGCAPVNSLEDVGAVAEEAVAKGFSAVKTYIFYPGLSRRSIFMTGRTITPEEIHQAEALVAAFRKHGGDDLGVALDIGWNFDMPSSIKLARVLEPYNMMFLETETLNAAALRTVRESSRTPICTGESIYMSHGFRPFLEEHAVDIIMPDIAWNGISMGKKIADFAEVYEVPLAPHNCHSPMTTMITAHLCMAIKNFAVMEFEQDDVPWRDDVLTHPLDIRQGHLYLSDRPGFGVDLNEAEIAKHPYRQLLDAH